MRNHPISSRRHLSRSPKATGGGDESDRTLSPTAAGSSAGRPRSPRRRDGAGGGSTPRGNQEVEPTSPQEARATDWLSAAVSAGGREADALTTAASGNKKSGKNSGRGGGGGGGDAADAGGGGRDAKLNSLLVLSPGKDYWAGRLAEKGSRDSESPRTAARNRERGRNDDNNNAAGGDGTAARSPTGVSNIISPARRGRKQRRQQRQQQQQHDEGGSRGGGISASASAAGKKKDILSDTGGKTATSLSPSSNNTDPSEAGLGAGGERPKPAPWRALESGEAWTPPSRPVAAPSPVVSWSPVKGQRRPDLRPSSRPVVREENTTVVAADPLPSGGVTRGEVGEVWLKSIRAGGDSGSSRTPSPMKSPIGGGFRGGVQSASPKEKKSPLGAMLGGVGRSASPLQKQV